MGAKWINPLGISGLDVQAEYNLVRPFTYTHEDHFRNYASYNLPLAHPAGANFTELTGRFTYQILPNLRLNGRGMLLRQGGDTYALNYGTDVLRSYHDRAQEYANTLGQGIANRTVQSELTLSYMPWHRIFVDLGVLLRDKHSVDPALSLKNADGNVCRAVERIRTRSVVLSQVQPTTAWKSQNLRLNPFYNP